MKLAKNRMPGYGEARGERCGGVVFDPSGIPRVNSRARRGRLPLYLLIKLLHDESKFLTIQVQLLSEGKFKRYTRRQYAKVSDKLTELWNKYETRQISTSRLLCHCSRLTLPFSENFLSITVVAIKMFLVPCMFCRSVICGSFVTF